jgi:hypothetical protein
LHSEISWISNYLNKFPTNYNLAIFNKVARYAKSTCRSQWFSDNSNAYFIQKNPLLRLFPRPVEGENLYNWCGVPAFSTDLWCITNRKKKCLIDTFFKIQHFQGAKVFLTKRTANNRRIPQLLKAFPNAKFIHVIRDGRAVAFSLLKVSWWKDHKVWWWNQKTPRQWEESGKNPIEMAARNWIEHIKEIDAGMKMVTHDHNFFQIRYEELAFNLLDIMIKLAKFIGVDIEKNWIEIIKTVSITNNNDIWKTKISKNDKLILLSIQNKTLERLGYTHIPNSY